MSASWQSSRQWVSIRPFAWTALNQNHSGVEESSTLCVEDLRKDKNRSRNRVKRHRAQKRYRPQKEEVKDIFCTEDFPSLPIVQQQIVVPEQVYLQKTLQVYNKTESTSYKEILVHQTETLDRTKLIPKVPIMKLKSTTFNKSIKPYSTKEVRNNFDEKPFIAPITKTLTPIAKFFKDRRQRITSIKRNSTQPLLRRDIVKILRTIRNQKAEQKKFFPITKLFEFSQKLSPSTCSQDEKKTFKSPFFPISTPSISYCY